MAEKQRDEGSVSRRDFLGYAAGSAIAFIGVALGFFGLGGVLSPALKPKKGGEWVRLGKVDSFKVGEPQKADFTMAVKDGWMESASPKSVWVVRQSDKGFTVFNSRCTHLGCIVNWKEGGRGWAFYSPCHAGIFTKEGVVVGGPPPRPLDRLEDRIQDGELWCEYQDFVLGIPEKKSL